MLPPWGLFEPHRGRPFAFFLDRAGDGRWSFAGSEPVRQLVVDSTGVCIVREGGVERRIADEPIAAIAAFVEDASIRLDDGLDAELADALPRTVGYLSYELGAAIEGVTVPAIEPVRMPMAVLSTYDRFDGWRPGMSRPRRFDLSGSGKRFGPVRPRTGGPGRPSPSFVVEPPFQQYRLGFERIKNAIADGEIYQANLSRRMTTKLDVDPIGAYRRLRAHQPVPYGGLLDYGDYTILSNSPECFLEVSADDIRTYPIKGTRARRAVGFDPLTTAELVHDPKERAEHLMIVDLERNDLGRVCIAGSVEVPEYARVESYTTVHHLVSEVRGKLAPGADLGAILRATFPGGSITGAPKIRSMQIIAEVEGEARGIYTGAIGCFNGGRRFLLSVAIRTAVAAAGLIHYRTGGGIVADSLLAAEYEETVTKAQAYLDSVLGRESAQAVATL